MTEWTQAARAELDRYLDEVRATLVESDADPSEVIEDLRRHVEEEATSAGLPVVSAEDVRRWVAKLGPAIEATGGVGRGAPPVVSSTGPSAESRMPKPSVWLLLLGVIVPALTLVIELVTGMCASAFFDPMPTFLHVLLVVFVPGVNLVTWKVLDRSQAVNLRWLGWLNGMAIGVAIFYSVLFFPLMLPGAIAVIFFGLGFLPWAPVLSLVATVGLRRHLRHRAQATAGLALPSAFKAMALGVAAVILIDGRVWITRWALAQALSTERHEQLQGLNWLRTLGDRDILLRECYGRTRRAADFDIYGWLFAGGRRVSADDARRVYYRVTGQPFNSVPPPTIRTGRGQALDLNDWTWDEDQGGKRVGGRVAGLTLLSSRMDAAIDAGAAVGYVEWILEFRNVADREREARAQIQLPPGGVVSRLTLWVDGEEREAAFSGRSQVRRAYQQIAIVQRRDPVLVTTCGPDRVLMQCFPVPANGGTMKLRLGMSVPLDLLQAKEGLLHWPRFLERNFTVPISFRHSLWAESQGELSSTAESLMTDDSQPDRHCLRGRIEESVLRRQEAAVRVQRPGMVRQVVGSLERDGESYRVLQKIRSVTNRLGGPVAVVVDGSRGMKSYLTAITEGLGQMAESRPVTVLYAGDETKTIDSSSTSALRRGLQRQEYAGGLDNVDALVQAWEAASRGKGGSILWLHLPKPVVFDSLAPLIQSYERRPNGPPLFVFPMGIGPNRVLERLNGFAPMRQISRSGSVREDLERWRRISDGQQPVWGLERRLLHGETPTMDSMPRASSHVVRLWALDEVNRLKDPAAIDLARKFQLVTTLSGAVVLETDQQYRATGLSPVDRDSVPSISIPDAGATWLLILIGCGAVAAYARRGAPRTGRPS
jgi:hypothetical protein